MKPFIVKNILSFLELDNYITEIYENQTKILTELENQENFEINSTKSIEKDLEPSINSNFQNIIYCTVGAILIIGIIYYFTSGGENGDSISTLFLNLNQEILQKINKNTIVIDNNMKYMLDTLRKGDDHLVDVINSLIVHNHEQLNKIVSIKLFNAILKNSKQLDDITKILGNINLTSNSDTIVTESLKKIVFSNES